ncbi:MAG: PepSY domain-containing protein [Brevundimonas sp.]|jgi:uncharacterized membrane protein YkoI|uniref:PepSY domain-containing protein n=1 Tax=Brevundimonas sp. TaxID=1871086 RepID=UPI00391AD194
MKTLLATVAALTLALPAGAAGLTASSTAIDDHNRTQQSRSDQRITREQAIEIARQNGLVRLKDVDREDYGWEVEGWTADGREIEVEINHDGSIRDIDYDD